MAKTTVPTVTSEATADATTGEPPGRPRIFYGWYMLGSMMGIHWYMSASFVYGFGALFVPILDTFGWSRGVGSLAASFRQPVGGAMGPLVGMFVDRYGARPVVIAGVCITALGMMSLAWMQALWMLFLSFGIISLGMSATLGVGFNSAIVNWFQRNRGRALGIGYSGAIFSGPFVGVVVWMESCVRLARDIVLARPRDADCRAPALADRAHATFGHRAAAGRRRPLGPSRRRSRARRRSGTTDERDGGPPRSQSVAARPRLRPALDGRVRLHAAPDPLLREPRLQSRRRREHARLLHLAQRGRTDGRGAIDRLDGQTRARPETRARGPARDPGDLAVLCRSRGTPTGR